MTLGRWVVETRESQGLSQSALAEKAGLSRAHLSEIERGRIAFPNADLRRRIAAALDVRHVDVLVAAGELSAEEIGPNLKPTYGDNRLAIVAREWSALSDGDKEFVLRLIEMSRKERGEEPLEDIVQFVSRSGINRAAR